MSDGQQDATIAEVGGRAVYDSNGIATVEVILRTGSGAAARAFAQRGSSTGKYEARHLERSDLQPSLAAVEPALANVHGLVREALLGADVRDQEEVDRRLSAIDSSATRASVGGNVLVATSTAAAELGARLSGIPVFQHLTNGRQALRLPQPTFNIIDGSLAPFSRVAHHEFLLFPAPGTATGAAVEMAVRVRNAVRVALYADGATAGDSPQGAVTAALPDVVTGLSLVTDAAIGCDYVAGRDFVLGLDMAAADVFDGERYRFDWSPSPLTTAELTETYAGWFDRFPLSYLEDGYAEECGRDFAELRRRTPQGAVIAGDDLFASNPERVTVGIKEDWADAVVLKPNQVGTVTGVLQAGQIASDGGMTVLLSQRSGENDTALIIHLGVATGATYIKCGGPSRLDRIIKLNELLRLEEQISPAAAG